jgi:hypothetical protein
LLAARFGPSERLQRETRHRVDDASLLFDGTSLLLHGASIRVGRAPFGRGRATDLVGERLPNRARRQFGQRRLGVIE